VLVSFTQTYGNDRRELLDIYFRDEKLIEFKNHFDVNYYSFHNTSDDLVEYFLSKNKVKNTIILRYNDCTYAECIKSLLNILDEIKCTHLFFSQDDTFSSENNDFDFEDFLKFVKSQKEDFMVCIGFSYYDQSSYQYVHLINPLNEKIYSTHNNSIWKANTLDYNYPTWNMSDEPYIATMDLVKNCYNDEYFKFEDIWNCEINMKERFMKEKMTRHISENPFFRNYNILGQNLHDKEKARKSLKDKKLIP